MSFSFSNLSSHLLRARNRSRRTVNWIRTSTGRGWEWTLRLLILTCLPTKPAAVPGISLYYKYENIDLSVNKNIPKKLPLFIRLLMFLENKRTALYLNNIFKTCYKTTQSKYFVFNFQGTSPTRCHR